MQKEKQASGTLIQDAKPPSAAMMNNASAAASLKQHSSGNMPATMIVRDAGTQSTVFFKAPIVRERDESTSSTSSSGTT